MTTPNLTDMPGMDDLKIGPGGQTFGQLKASVIDTRADFQSALMRGQADDSLLESYESAVSMLRAAYTRVGLPYTAP